MDVVAEVAVSVDFVVEDVVVVDSSDSVPEVVVGVVFEICFLNISKLCSNGEKERYSEMFSTEARERFIVESIARGAHRLVRHENLQKASQLRDFILS